MDAELLRKLYEDLVEKPYIPLSQTLTYELYKICLPVPGLQDDIKEWLSLTSTFQQFRRNVLDMIDRHQLSINIDAINKEDWKKYVVTNDIIIYLLDDWRRSGTVEIIYDWWNTSNHDLSV